MCTMRKRRICQKYEGNEERVKRALERERFIVPEESSFYFYMKTVTIQRLGK